MELVPLGKPHAAARHRKELFPAKTDREVEENQLEEERKNRASNPSVLRGQRTEVPGGEKNKDRLEGHRKNRGEFTFKGGVRTASWPESKREISPSFSQDEVDPRTPAFPQS